MVENRLTSNGSESFTPPEELLKGQGYELRRKLDITEVSGFKLTKPLDILVYEAHGKTNRRFAAVHRLPSLDGKPRLIEGHGATLEDACRDFVSALVKYAEYLGKMGSTIIGYTLQGELERQYLDTLLIQE